MVRFDRVAIIGVGLLGGSFALALRKYGAAGEIRGAGRREENLKRALDLGIIDSYDLSPHRVVLDADLVVLATPVGIFKTVVEECRSSLKEGAIVTDVGSCKGRIVEMLEGLMPEGVAFVGGHPIAGSDRSGIDTATGDLFKGAKCILTPTERTPEGALKRVRDLWDLFGADVSVLSPEEHDLIFGLVSHLPHLLSYALVNTIDSINPEYIHYAGAGFRDTTRVALSSPELWRDICLKNKDNLIKLAGSLKDHIDSIVDALIRDDVDGLETLFRRAQQLRSRLNNN